MATLDLEVLRKNRHEDTFQAAGDPQDVAWLQRQLGKWLTDRKWATSRWGEFELIARPAGRGKQLAKVRT
jgi:Holliday junction resolvase-like predicted endonuclease